MMFFWLAALLVLPFAAFSWMRDGAVGCCGVGHMHTAAAPDSPVSTAPTAEDPLGMARLRLARGEITVGEFEQIRSLLS